MGNVMSRLEFNTSWRNVTWGKATKNALKEDIKKIQPQCTTKLKCLRVILVGPAGSGKSSFINSVNNAFQGRITSNALSDRIGGESFTVEYKAYKIEAGNSNLSIVFNDVMGLETGSTRGCHPDDILKAINGFMKTGHMFNPKKPLAEKHPDCNKEPELSDEVYCMVYVLAADRICFASESILQKLRNIRLEVRHLDLPQVIVMTNVDQACPLVKNNLQKVYYSKKIKEKMEWCSNAVGVPMCHIFPVKNYHEEIETNDDMDLLILQALTQIIQLAGDNVRIRLEKETAKSASKKRLQSQ